MHIAILDISRDLIFANLANSRKLVPREKYFQRILIPAKINSNKVVKNFLKNYSRGANYGLISLKKIKGVNLMKIGNCWWKWLKVKIWAKEENKLFQNIGSIILGVGFAENAISHTKIPKKCIFSNCSYLFVHFNKEFYKIRKPGHSPCSHQIFSHFRGMYST